MRSIAQVDGSGTAVNDTLSKSENGGPLLVSAPRPQALGALAAGQISRKEITTLSVGPVQVNS